MAESFNAELERMKHGVFHHLSKKHLQRYVKRVPSGGITGSLFSERMARQSKWQCP